MDLIFQDNYPYSQKKQITDFRILKDIVTHLTYFSIGDVYNRAYLETDELLELSMEESPHKEDFQKMISDEIDHALENYSNHELMNTK